MSGGLLRVWWWWCAGIGGIVAVAVRSFSFGCGSILCFLELVEGFFI